MILIKIYNEVVTGVIGLISLALYLFALVGLSMGLVNKFKYKLTSSRLVVGVMFLFIISYILPEILIRIIFFPKGDYVNYGLVGGMSMIVLIAAFSIATAFIASVIYFKWITKK